MSYHVAALHGPPGVPPATVPAAPGAAVQAASERPLLPALVDWALREASHQGLDRPTRLAMVTARFDALAALARQAPADGIRLRRDALVVDAGHLVPLASEPGGVDAALTIGVSHASLARADRAGGVSAALQAFLAGFSAQAGRQVLVLASYGSAPSRRGPEVERQLNDALGKGRHPTASERAVEARLWERLASHLARLQAASDPSDVSAALQDWWNDVKPAHCGLRASLSQARGFVGQAILVGLRPVIDGLRQATADGFIDHRSALALAQASLEQARARVDACDAGLPPLPEAPAADADRAEPAALQARFVPQRAAQADEQAAEVFVWRDLARALGDLRCLVDTPPLFLSRLLVLRGIFSSGSALDPMLLQARPHLRNIVLERVSPCMRAIFEAVRDGHLEPEAGHAQLASLIAANRRAVLAADGGSSPRY